MILHPSLESLLTWLELSVEITDDEDSGDSAPAERQDTGAQGRQSPETLVTNCTSVTRKQKPTRNTPPLSEIEQQLKWRSHYQLQQFLLCERFPRAIVLVEGLAQRLPHDPEVRQWQAIAYQRWGRQLLKEKQLNKARIYLKKALKTDPHNRALWSEVEGDFRRLEQLFYFNP